MSNEDQVILPPDGCFDWDAEPDLDALRAAHRLIETDQPAAITELKRLAGTGSIMSAIYLGEILETSNIEAAIHWYHEAARRGAPLASFNLGVLALAQRKQIDARGFFERSFASGYGPAARPLARLLYDGEGGARDVDRAKALLDRASAAGYIFAKRDLAFHLMKGHFGRYRPFKGVLLLLCAIWSVPFLLSNEEKREYLG